MVEVKSRGAKLFGLTTYGNYAMEDVADFTVYTPRIDNLFAASLSVVPLQLLSYYVSCEERYGGVKREKYLQRCLQCTSLPSSGSHS